MKHLLYGLCFMLLSGGMLINTACGQAQSDGTKINAPTYQLKDFYTDNASLDAAVDSVYNTLNEQQRVAQMIITSAGELGKPDATVEKLIAANKVGGVILMKGSKTGHQQRVTKFNKVGAANKSLPLLYSMDAEPSLLNGRIKGSPKMAATIKIKDEWACDSITQVINKQLQDIGVQHNYAPVVDVSPNNAAIKTRSFGDDPGRIVSMSNQFIQSSQNNGIIATAKHFPGHGLVKGDTHKQSVYIDGDLLEVDNYYPLIEKGVLTIMVAHIVVKNNELYDTKGLPSTLSRKIVTDLLKEKMNFKGLVITDALNAMKAVTIYKDAPLQASKAGCDLLLMPIDETKTMDAIIKEMKTNAAYKAQVETSVKKIIRMKICAGLIG